MKKSLIVLIFVALTVISCKEKNPWTDLIGDNLDNWEQLNGTAEYRLVNGSIEGISVADSPNSFLCTKEHYGDFILEYDVMVDPVMNSGVQIRSHSLPEYDNGRVHGYQVEIDPEPRAWSGGIYDEARRMWLYPLDRNQEGRKAFVNGQFNHFRVEAIGNSIRTWCNGVPCADLIDDMTASGFIALQVHGIGNDSTKVGKKVIFKNMRIITDDPGAYATPYKKEIPQNSYLVNALSSREREEGWILLFDGSTNEGWRSVDDSSFPGEGWLIEGGEISRTGPGKDIITRDIFNDFELILDFKYARRANSGVKYFVSGDRENDPHYNLGCEYQIVDGRAFPSLRDNERIGGLYDLISPASPRDNGPGIWNRARIVVKGSHVEHWLNNQMTLEYEREGEGWKELVSGSKFRDVPGFGEAEEGHILLQNHEGTEVSFRSIKIKEL
ncbi:MAG: 3-keto-disaccharide hydrolase [Bacteroidota bacterium]